MARRSSAATPGRAETALAEARSARSCARYSAPPSEVTAIAKAAANTRRVLDKKSVDFFDVSVGGP